MLVLPYTHRHPRGRGESRFALCGAEVTLGMGAKMTRKDDEVNCPHCIDVLATQVELMLDIGRVGGRACPACNGSKEGKGRKPCRECAALGMVPADAEREEIGGVLQSWRGPPPPWWMDLELT